MLWYIADINTEIGGSNVTIEGKDNHSTGNDKRLVNNVVIIIADTCINTEIGGSNINNEGKDDRSTGNDKKLVNNIVIYNRYQYRNRWLKCYYWRQGRL